MFTLVLVCVVVGSLALVMGFNREGPAPTWTFERIEPPDRFPDHPRLFLNRQEIDALKAAVAADPSFAAPIERAITELRQAAASPKLPIKTTGENLDIAKQAANFAVAYALTDELAFAEAAAAILRRYAEVFPGYEPAHLKGLATSAALDEAVWAVDAAAAYDLIYNAGVLSEGDKQAIEQDVFRASAEVLRRCNHAYRSNWRIRAVGGLAAMAFCIGDRELIDEVFNGVRGADGLLVRDGFVQHMAWSVLADGIYYERSQSYSEEIGDAFAHVLEAARHSGIDLWDRAFDGSPYDAGADRNRRFGDSTPKTVKCVYDAVLYRAFGDGTLAKVANTYWNHLGRRDGWSAAWRATGDDRYAWPLVLDDGRDSWLHDLRDLLFMPPRPPAGRPGFAVDTDLGLTGQHVNACTFLPNGGYAILRQDASRDAASVAMTFGDFANGHCQADQLSIVVYAAGRQPLPDTKYFRYIEPHLTWSKQTISHNTVTVDGRSQIPQGDSDDMWISPPRGAPVFGRPLLFHAGDDLKAVGAICETAYDGVRIDRTVALIGSTVVDFYRCRSDDEHQYDYALHVDGKLTRCSLPLGDQKAGPLAESYGYRHIVDLRRAAMNNERVQLAYDTDDASEPLVHLTLLPIGKAELVLGNGMEGLEGERAEVVIVRKTAGDVDFVSVIDPVANGGTPLDVAAIDDLPEGVLGVSVVRPGGQTDIILSAESPKTFTYLGCEIMGQVALLRVSPDGSARLVDTAE